jgi:CheY-like chemotaxis protein
LYASASQAFEHSTSSFLSCFSNCYFQGNLVVFRSWGFHQGAWDLLNSIVPGWGWRVDPAVCELVRAVLISLGYSVLSTRHPHEAETLCKNQAGRIDLLLSDVVMPEMSGGELSGRLQQKNPDIKVLFMSGYIDEAVVHQGIQEKKVAFLQKPFSPLSLAKKVRDVLDGLPPFAEPFAVG